MHISRRPDKLQSGQPVSQPARAHVGGWASNHSRDISAEESGEEDGYMYGDWIDIDTDRYVE